MHVCFKDVTITAPSHIKPITFTIPGTEADIPLVSDRDTIPGLISTSRGAVVLASLGGKGKWHIFIVSGSNQCLNPMDK